MDNAADLEIQLSGSDDGDWAVQLRYWPGDGTDRYLLAEPAPLALDFDALELVATDDYGAELGRQAFPEPVAREVRGARALAHGSNRDLRIRLVIGLRAAKLHGLRWEAAEVPAPPEGGAPPLRLGTAAQVRFSRHLSGGDGRPVQLRPQNRLRALVAIAAPTNLEADYSLAPIDVQAELARIRPYLQAFDPVEITGASTLDQVARRLAEEGGDLDIFVLIAHGAFASAREPRLWLEASDRQASVTPASALVSRLGDLERPPRLAVLVACQSAGAADDRAGGDPKALSALGPRLAEAGIPAVLAMQARLTMETEAVFLPRFFQELAKHGQADRAAALARADVAGRKDWWAPVLFTRISHGRIWYVPGFSGMTGVEVDDWWEGLADHVQHGECTPILGGGMLEGLIGPARAMARRWADESGFAMDPHDREDLPQVAQYLAVTRDPAFARRGYLKMIDAELERRHGRGEGEIGREERMAAIRRSRALRPGRASLEPHAALASLPFPVFITANPDDQLPRALRDAGKDPQVELCRWHTRPGWAWPASVFDESPAGSRYVPTPGRPLVYHLFGRLDEPKSLVLTEDDYFDFLIGMVRNAGLVPTPVKRALANTALLFLGFRMEEWDFRVLFRSVLAQGDRGQLPEDFRHVAAQIDPEEGRTLDVGKARKYLERYFQEGQVTIFWGGIEEFAAELVGRLRRLTTTTGAG